MDVTAFRIWKTEVSEEVGKYRIGNALIIWYVPDNVLRDFFFNMHHFFQYWQEHFEAHIIFTSPILYLSKLSLRATVLVYTPILYRENFKTLWLQHQNVSVYYIPIYILLYILYIIKTHLLKWKMMIQITY